MSADTSNLLRSEAELVLEEARRQKAERIKTLGSPIELPGKPLAIQARGGNAWIAESTSIVRVVGIETGKTIQTYRGHTAPVTCLTFHTHDEKLFLITGSWDKTIKIWDTSSRECISSTDAHEDFVKALLVIPSLQLLVSSSSDKIVRFWDLANAAQGTPLVSAGSISSHTRPVEALEGTGRGDSSGVLYTADTMGILKVWGLEKESGPLPRWRATLRDDLVHHRTKINELVLVNSEVWTASSDDSVQILTKIPSEVTNLKDSKTHVITHPTAVRAILPLQPLLNEPYLITGAGDIIRTYDLSTLSEPEILSEVDGHWHDVTALRLWVRKTVSEGDGKTRIEPWIISTSLDGTIRKWRLSELLSPPPLVKPTAAAGSKKDEGATSNPYGISEEEERELEDLMNSD